MKKRLFYLLIAIISTHVHAQGTYTFQSTEPILITDSVTLSTIDVYVPFAVEDFGVTRINVDISYPTTGLLAILINDYMLSGYNGGEGSDYINTTLLSLGTPGVEHITAASAPFTGEYGSELNFDLLSAFPLNGPWTLKLLTPLSLAGGVLNSWSITFTYTAGTPTVVNPTTSTVVGMYPNPANDLVVLTTPVQDDKIRTAWYNTYGQQVLEQTLASAIESPNIDVREFPNGIYTVVSLSNANRYVNTISIQH